MPRIAPSRSEQGEENKRGALVQAWIRDQKQKGAYGQPGKRKLPGSWKGRQGLTKGQKPRMTWI